MKKLITSLAKTRNPYFFINPKNQSLHKPTLHFPGKHRNFNHRHISLIETDPCNFVILSFLKTLTLKKEFSYFFQYFRKSARKSKSNGLSLERLRNSFKEWF